MARTQAAATSALETQQAIHFYSANCLGARLSSKQVLVALTSEVCSWFAVPHPHCNALCATSSASDVVPAVREQGVKELEKKWSDRHVGIRGPSHRLPCHPPRAQCYRGACVCKHPLKAVLARLSRWIGTLNNLHVDGNEVVLVWERYFVDEDDATAASTAGMGVKVETLYTHISFFQRSPQKVVLWHLIEHERNALRPDPLNHHGMLLIPLIIDGFPKLQMLDELICELYSLVDPACAWDITVARLSRRQSVVPDVHTLRIELPMDTRQLRCWGGDVRRRRHRERVALHRLLLPEDEPDLDPNLAQPDQPREHAGADEHEDDRSDVDLGFVEGEEVIDEVTLKFPTMKRVVTAPALHPHCQFPMTMMMTMMMAPLLPALIMLMLWKYSVLLQRCRYHHLCRHKNAHKEPSMHHNKADATEVIQKHYLYVPMMSRLATSRSTGVSTTSTQRASSTVIAYEPKP